MTKICCVCSKVEQDGYWINGRVTSALEQLTHGYCPACYADVMEDLSRFLKKRDTDQPSVVQVESNCEVPDVCA